MLKASLKFFIVVWWLSNVSPLVAQVMQFGDNEDFAVYGNDITEFTWMRGQYTNHRLDEAARVVFEEAVGGIQIIQILMKIFCAASCATLMWTQIQKITNIFSLLIQNFLSIFFFI